MQGMNTHAYYQELISRLLDEDAALTAEENRGLQAHLAECADCAAVYQAFSSLSDALGKDLEEPPARLRENVMAELRREEIRRKNRRRSSPVAFIAAAAVLALAIGLGPRLAAPKNSADSAVYTAQAAAGAVYAEEAQQRSFAADKSAESNAVYAAAADAPEAQTDPAAPAEEDAEKHSLESLLLCLSGTESELDPDALGLSPLFLIDTDGGVLEIYRYGGNLYYIDPVFGGVYEAGCSQEALVAFLQS